MPIYLINRDDIAEYRQISDSVFDDTLNQYILDAQFSDIQKLMGMNFYNDLIRNFTDTKYTELLKGGTYNYQNITYTNVGLKVVLVHYTYARYVLLGSSIDTSFSFVEKLNEGKSQPVSQAAKQTIYKMNQQTAFNYWENVLAFLSRNNTQYPLWLNQCSVKNNSFRASTIGSNKDNEYNFKHFKR